MIKTFTNLSFNKTFQYRKIENKIDRCIVAKEEVEDYISVDVEWE